ncbi:hypothetical protein ABFX02_11G014000 [Erythranthe guttata]
MWALRRASINLRNRGLSSGIARICCAKPEIARCYLENCNSGIVDSHKDLSNTFVHSTRAYNTSSYSNPYMEARTFSSEAGAKSSEEQTDDVADAFTELDTPLTAVRETASADEADESMSEAELSEGESIENELDTLETKTDAGERRSKTRATSAMFKAILASNNLPVGKVLDKWVEAGNEVTRTEASMAMFDLRKRRMFVRALQLSEWLESSKSIEYKENAYASRVDLIAKVRSIFKAEEYISKIPESFRGEIVYRTLLANCIAASNVKKSEELFNKMKSLFPITCFSCNQLLLLYKRVDKKKIAEVLSLMERENVKMSHFTYQILIDVKGQSKDITGMEQIVETMKSKEMEPNTKILLSLARNYVSAGLKDKAEAVLKEMEGGDIVKNRWACRYLLPIYASLEREDEVERIWKVCESNPRHEECMAGIEAWGHLKRIEDAESAFDKMMKKLQKPSSKHFTALLKIYADHKMLEKGKDLVKRMSESGCSVGPLVWNAVVKLYVGSGEVEKADSILEKAIKGRKGKPLCDSFLAILDGYANKGDVHNAERIFMKIREAGYTARAKPYKSLLYAYINAKAPAYGFRERLKADNVDADLGALLARVDAFGKKALTKSSQNLLDV